MANAKLGTKAVGNIVKLKVNGTAKEFIVVHQGKPGSMYDDSCNGTWLLMKDCYEKRVWSSADVNKYESSDIHTYLNSNFLNLFDNDIRDAIKQVKLPYRKNGGYGGTTQQGANGLPCKIFLLSVPEVHYEHTYIDSGEGAALSYFASCVTNGADSKRVAYLSGSTVIWWLRSPFTISTSNAGYVDVDGDCNASRASYSYGIRPALILPPDMEVDSSGNVTPPPPPPATHKTLVNGTVYEVKGGKCLVNGTVYSIKKGRTLIGGTGYDITFEEAIGKTWVINKRLYASAFNDSYLFNASFVSNGQTFSGFFAKWVSSEYQLGYFTDVNQSMHNQVYKMEMVGAPSWSMGEAYRTITFSEPPTGDLLTWLQANAVQQ